MRDKKEPVPFLAYSPQAARKAETSGELHFHRAFYIDLNAGRGDVSMRYAIPAEN
jgi:hypothetical protein